MISFVENTHTYLNQSGTKLSSVTGIISKYKQEFDPIASSEKASKNKKSKWYKMDPEAIRKIWDAERERSMKLGTKYHLREETNILSTNTIQLGDKIVPVYRPIYDSNGHKVSSDQRLEEGVYPEHMVYYKDMCGQSDRVEVIDGVVNIEDHKTSKKIEMESFKDWKGKSQKMKAPVAHLDDCNFNHYALQGSFYMYFILRHNPTLKPGKIIINHIIFEYAETDQYGYPVGESGEFKEIVRYELPYLKTEVIAMMKHYNGEVQEYRNIPSQR